MGAVSAFPREYSRPERRGPSRWIALAVVTLAHALGAVAVLAVAPLSPLLLDALELSRTQIGLLLPAVYLGGVVMSLPAGWLTDHLGVRATIVLGQLLTGLALAATALTSGLPSLLGLLCLGGFGWSVVNPASGRAILEHFSPRERGFAMGIKQTGLTVGGIAAALSLPPLALALGWRRAMAVAASGSLFAAALVGVGYRRPPVRLTEAPGGRPRLGEVRSFLARPALLVVFACGLALSIAQASILSYLTLYANEALGYSVVAAGRLLALAQAGGTVARLAWGFVSDRFFGGRRRPGLVINAVVGAMTYAVFAVGVSGTWAPPLAVVAGGAGFGWVGLYLALMAEIGGVRYAGLLTGVAVSVAWSGVLVGPPLFGLVLEATGSYRFPWLGLAVLDVVAAVSLARLRPLVQRGPLAPPG